MNDRVVALRVGIVVLAAAFLTGFLVVLIGEGRSFWQSHYTVYLKTPQAPGVSVETPIRKNGVLIGRVTDIKLEDTGDVTITARIDGKYKIFADDMCQIRMSSLLGDSLIEFVPSNAALSSKKLVQDQEVIGDVKVASDPLRVLNDLQPKMEEALTKFGTAADDFSSLTKSLQRSLGTEENRIQSLMANTDAAMKKFTTVMNNVNNVIGEEDVQARLKEGLVELPRTLTQMRETMAKAHETLKGFESVQVKAERSFENINQLTEPFAKNSKELARNVNGILSNLDTMSAEVADLAKRVKSSDGSLAKLIRDDELYNKVYSMVDNLNDASRRIRPILDNVRVLTDKLATDPRQLGVKGALDAKPLGVGIKGVPHVREPRIQLPEEE